MNNIRDLLHHMDAAGCMWTQVVVSKVWRFIARCVRIHTNVFFFLIQKGELKTVFLVLFNFHWTNLIAFDNSEPVWCLKDRARRVNPADVRRVSDCSLPFSKVHMDENLITSNDPGVWPPCKLMVIRNDAHSRFQKESWGRLEEWRVARSWQASERDMERRSVSASFSFLNCERCTLLDSWHCFRNAESLQSPQDLKGSFL